MLSVPLLPSHWARGTIPRALDVRATLNLRGRMLLETSKFTSIGGLLLRTHSPRRLRQTWWHDWNEKGRKAMLGEAPTTQCRLQFFRYPLAARRCNSLPHKDKEKRQLGVHMREQLNTTALYQHRLSTALILAFSTFSAAPTDSGKIFLLLLAVPAPLLGQFTPSFGADLPRTPIAFVARH